MNTEKPKNILIAILSIFTILIGFALFAFIVWGGYKFITYIFQILKTLNTNVAVAIIVGSATIIASTLAVVLGRYFEAKKEREAVHRDKKIALYDEFLKEIFDIFLGNEEKKRKQENLVPILKDIQRKIILWSGPYAIKVYAEWHKDLTSQVQQPKAKSMIKMINFFLALRKDLGHSNKGIKPEYLVRFMLRNPDLFMGMYKKNPEVTFDEIAKFEKELKLNSHIDTSAVD